MNENEILKARLQFQAGRIEELESQNKNYLDKLNCLYEQIKIIESVSDTNADKVEELKGQIEKMKCFRSCSYATDK